VAETLVTRRANGGLFSEEINGRLCSPARSNRGAVARCRERDAELLIHLPARLDDSLTERIASDPNKEGHTIFSLSGQWTRRTLISTGED
jgi:hypothetical protein